MKALVRYAYAPFMILGLNGVALAIVAAGASFLWLAPVLAFAIAASFAAERILPCHQEWNHPQGDQRTDLLHVLFYEAGAINAVAMLPIVAWLVPWKGIWPHDWPLVIQVLIGIVFMDLVFMLVHYASHHHPMLWRLHSVHHGVPRMYGFNGFVRHPLHQTLDTVLGATPLALAGMSTEVAVLVGLAVSIQLIVQHSNVDYALGPFEGHLAIGRLHHLHHVSWGKEGDVNFGLFFTIWDRMLGTLRMDPPRAIRHDDLGIDDAPRFPRGFVDQLIYPFAPERYRLSSTAMRDADTTKGGSGT